MTTYGARDIIRRQRESCACKTPQRTPGRILRPREFMHETAEIAERVRPRQPRGVEPVVLAGGPGAKCRPFLTVHKDDEKFAACNALADEIGPLDTPKKMIRIIEDAIGDEVNEVFGILMLDIHLRLKGLAETGRGEPSSVMAPLKPTLQMALISGADSVALWHVHPSGIEAEPSDADIETTEAFADACDAIDLPLLDHLVLGGDVRKRSFFSFLEAGLL